MRRDPSFYKVLINRIMIVSRNVDKKITALAIQYNGIGESND